MPIFKLQAALSTLLQLVTMWVIFTYAIPPIKSSLLEFVWARMFLSTLFVALFAVGVGLASVRSGAQLKAIGLGILLLVMGIVLSSLIQNALPSLYVSRPTSKFAGSVLSTSAMLITAFVTIYSLMKAKLRASMDEQEAVDRLRPIRTTLFMFFAVQALIDAAADATTALGTPVLSFALHSLAIVIVWVFANRLDGAFDEMRA